MALGLRPSSALLADRNELLVNFLTWLQRGLVIDQPMLNEEGHFYAARTRLNHLIRDGQAQSPEAAGLFYYLNRTCYNGLCRFNSRGEFNVPFGRYKTITYTTDFRHYAPALQPWEFRCGDFERLNLGPADFLYADPPYDVNFTRYSRDDFTWTDQVRLAEWLARHPGPVVASNQATDRILALYRSLGFTIDTLPAPRRISCNGDRSDAVEMLAVKNLAPP